MPASGTTGLTLLGAQLRSTLLEGVALILAVAVILATAALILRSRNPIVFARITTRWIGSAGGEPTRRRALRVSLGLLWIVDGALQAQPRMPAGFVPDVIAPAAANSPGWLTTVVHPLESLWQQHPVTADAITVWLQLGIGLLILLSGWTGLLQRIVLWLSIGWGLFIWMAGEFCGGLLSSGASWLMGAPGSVLVYVLFAALLLREPASWAGDRAARDLRRAASGFFLLGAVLQAVPGEGNWTVDGMVAPFAKGLTFAQPAILSSPIRSVATLVAHHSAAFNLLLVLLLAAIGLGLWIGPPTVFVGAGVVTCVLTWWLAQDFGVLGGVGTDPNTGLPLALLLACALPMRLPAPESGLANPRRRSDDRVGIGRSTSRATVLPTIALATIAVTTVVLLPAGLTLSMARGADPTAALADSGGGIVALDQRAAPDFSLTDQRGNPISISSQRGKLVLLTFLDPVCSDECPVIANQLASVSDELGPLANRVEIIAIDSNPVFHNVADVAAFTTSHGLDRLSNWHFLSGTPQALRAVLDQYGVSVEVPSVGMISHSEGIYFLSADGSRVAYVADGANPNLNRSYADVIAEQIRKQLR